MLKTKFVEGAPRALDRLGVADQVRAKYEDTGTRAGEMVAAGEIELAAAQIPELMAVPGAAVVGALLAGPPATSIYKTKGLGG